MIDKIENNITFAIGEMEKEKAVHISGYIKMGNKDEYYYEIKKLKQKLKELEEQK